METSLNWLVSLLLVLQLVGASVFASPAPQDQQAAQASELSSLSAVLGKPVPICRHGGLGSPTPGMPSDCDHCTLCHVTAGGVALPTIDGIAAPAAVVATIEHPLPAVPAAAPRRFGSASPRGPPRLV